MKMSEHLLFLALMVPTILLLVLAALLISQPALPAPLSTPQPVAAAPAYTFPPVDERGYDGTY